MNYRLIYKDELYHHGVKGMKWGVRKKQPSADQMKATIEAKRLANFKKEYGRDPYKAESIPSLGTLNAKKEAAINKKYIPAKDREELKRDKALSKLDKKYKVDKIANEYAKKISDDIKKHGEDPSQYPDYVRWEARNQALKDPRLKGYTSNQDKIWDRYETRTKKIGEKYAKKYNKMVLKEANWSGSYKRGVKELEKVRKDYIVLGSGNVWPRDWRD